MSKIAIFETGSRQFGVGVGDQIRIPRVPGNPGDAVTFDRVMLVRQGDNTETGRPHVEGARILGQIVEQGRDDKIVVFKFKRRTAYRRKNGHRQPHTVVRITDIQA